jgi:proline iminopeptidase
MVFMKRFQSRADPWPPELDSTAAAFARDTIPNRTVFGPGGDALGYDRTDRSGEITVPTLFTAGRYDRATPATTAYYQSLMPGSELVVFEHSAHLPMVDEPTRYVTVLRDFLDHVDAQ